MFHASALLTNAVPVATLIIVSLNYWRTQRMLPFRIEEKLRNRLGGHRKVSGDRVLELVTARVQRADDLPNRALNLVRRYPAGKTVLSLSLSDVGETTLREPWDDETFRKACEATGVTAKWGATEARTSDDEPPDLLVEIEVDTTNPDRVDRFIEELLDRAAGYESRQRLIS